MGIVSEKLRKEQQLVLVSQMLDELGSLSNDSSNREIDQTLNNISDILYDAQNLK
jgi:hypothetical protein